MSFHQFVSLQICNFTIFVISQLVFILKLTDGGHLGALLRMYVLNNLLIKTAKHRLSRLRLSLPKFNMKMAPMVILKTLATAGLFVGFQRIGP